MIELECRKVEFFSSQDKASFFAWAQGIASVSSVSGSDSTVIIRVKTKGIPAKSLRELLALFRRHNVSMGQLSQFVNARNESWSGSPAAYWHKLVFSALPERPPGKFEMEHVVQQ
jgi:hypothetical protein